MPRISAVEMVVPLLDSPGIQASPCVSPIIADLLALILLGLGLTQLPTTKIPAVKAKKRGSRVIEDSPSA